MDELISDPSVSAGLESTLAGSDYIVLEADVDWIDRNSD